MPLLPRILATACVLLAVVGCADSGDERRVGAIGESQAEVLSWGGDWTAEAAYEPGTVVTHEGGTFIAVTTTTQAPDAKCEVDCAWTLMADTTGEAINTQPPPAPPKIQVFDYTTGYSGPVELPTIEFVNYLTIGADLVRWQQEVNDWLTDIAPWIVRHRDDDGTVVAEKLVEQGGSYLVFARGVFVSAPGLGKTPIPQGSTPTLGSVISNTMVNGSLLGTLAKSWTWGVARPQVTNFVKGPGSSDYSLACTLSANREPLDDASMTLSEKGTASASLMGFVVTPADVKFAVGCVHNGRNAGPFVRDLRLVAVKLD